MYLTNFIARKRAIMSGPGLAVCRGFVEAMHGRISAAGRTDRSGAVLTVGLPIPATVDALETAA
jgi:two-component system, OmpR family, sensor histidine kinase KdpD